VDGGEEDGGGAEMGSAMQWIGLDWEGGREVRDSLRSGGWWDQREARGEVQARADAGRRTRDRMKVLMGFFSTSYFLVVEKIGRVSR
jgi:hypothetical protein